MEKYGGKGPCYLQVAGLRVGAVKQNQNWLLCIFIPSFREGVVRETAQACVEEKELNDRLLG